MKSYIAMCQLKPVVNIFSKNLPQLTQALYFFLIIIIIIILILLLLLLKSITYVPPLHIPESHFLCEYVQLRNSHNSHKNSPTPFKINNLHYKHSAHKVSTAPTHNYFA